MIRGTRALDPLEVEKEIWERFNAFVGEKNAEAIGSSGGILAVLDSTNIDSDTASGTGYAFTLGKKILGYGGSVSPKITQRASGRSGRILRTKKRPSLNQSFFRLTAFSQENDRE